RKIDVREGDMIFKPLGPDLPTQLLADRGEAMSVLDIEIWRDPARGDKDVVIYPDHNEITFFGSGWYNMVPLDSAMPAKDAMENYHTGYRRSKDGSWESADLPGLKRRKE
ncbi:MAG: hypothetical protein QXV22_01720, partial [Thermoplasmataceae archaeon]